jgi:hypothetical protein
MDNSITNANKVDRNSTTERNSTTRGEATPSVDRSDATTIAPVTKHSVRSSRRKKLFAALGIGVGAIAIAVSTWQYPDEPAPAPKPSKRFQQQRVVLVSTSQSANLTLADRSIGSPTSDRQPDLEPAEAPSAPTKILRAIAAVKEAKTALTLSQSHVAQTEINLQTFKNNYERHQDLHRRNAINRQQLEQSQVAYNFATTQKSQALHGLKQAQTQLTAAEVKLDRVRSQLAQATPNRACNRAKNIQSREAM